MYINCLKGMTKKTLLIFAILLVIIGFFIVRKAYLVNQSKTYNIILISVDTLRVDHMGIYGYSKNTTPNIDAWAKKAAIFTNVRTVVPYTNPSITAFMTGLHPFSTKITENAIGPLISKETPTIAKILQKDGYRTVAYITNRFIGPRLSNQKIGFDEFNFMDAFGLWKEEKSRKKYISFIDKATDSLKKNAGKKQFVWIHLMDPHAPYYPTKQFLCKFNQKDCAFLSKSSNQELARKMGEYNSGCRNKSAPNTIVDRYQSLYDGDVAEADLLVGNILKKLKETGLDKKSIVIFYGDHGEEFGHNYYFRHGLALYDSSLKIPLIIKHPLFQGKKIDKLIDNTDVFPTLLDLLNMSSIKKTLDGKSFIHSFLIPSLFDAITLLGKKYAFSTNRTVDKFSIFDGKYKYIYSIAPSCFYKNQKEELYDIKNDPSENTNLIIRKKAVATRLKDILQEQMRKYNLPQSAKPSYYSPVQKQDILNQLKGLGY